MTVKPLNRDHVAVTTKDNWLIQTVQRVNPQWWPSLLRVSDSLLIVLAFVVAYLIRYRLQWFRAVDPVFQTDFSSYILSCVALVAILFLLFHFSGVYRQRRGRLWLEEVYTIASATTIGVVILITINLIFSPMLYSRLLFLYTAFLVVLFLGTGRAAIGLVRGYLRRHGLACSGLSSWVRAM
ncbi:MAG: hypothetical protein R2873_30710 [Caldilineaceae bacterium]